MLPIVAISITLALAACSPSGQDLTPVPNSPDSPNTSPATTPDPPDTPTTAPSPQDSPTPGPTDAPESTGPPGEAPAQAAQPTVGPLEEEGVVAIVNGEEIEGQELEDRVAQLRASYAQQGMQVQDEAQLEQLRSQVLDSLVQEELLLQYASEQGITVSEDEVSQERQRMVSQFGGEEALQQAMSTQGIEQDELNEILRQGLVIQKVVDQAVSEAETDIQPTEAELRERYEQMVGQAQQGPQGQQVPSFEEVRDRLEQSLTQQKRSQVMQEFISGLEEEAEVEMDP